MKTKIIHVSWVDSATQTGWMYKNQVDIKPCPCETVGFLVRENNKSISLALSRSTNENYKPFGDVINIPKGSIKKRKILKIIKDK